MRSSTLPVALTLLAVAAGCHIDDLVDAPPTGILVASPANVQATAAAGSSAPKQVAVVLRSARDESVSWTLERAGEEPWLTVTESAGTTPDTVHLTLDPADLPAGRHSDTLLLVPDDPDVATTRVPVTLNLVLTASRLQFAQAPTTSVAGAPITPAIAVAAVDQEGEVETSFGGTVTLTLGSGPTGATLSGDRTVSAVNGVATFPGLSLDRAGTGYTITASAPDLVAITSPTFAITPGAATRLSITVQPSHATPNAPITPAVEVTAFDGYGNLATGFTAAVTIAIGRDGSPLQNAQLGGTKTRNAAAGVVRFTDLTIDQVGTGYTLTVSATGPSGATSESFSITPLGGSPTAQQFGQQPTAAPAGTAISPPVTVRIIDALGSVVPSYDDAVTLTLIDGTSGAVLGGTTSAMPDNGVATFSGLTVDRPGTGYRLRASTSTLPVITSAPFNISIPPPVVGAIRVSTTTTGNDVDPDGYTAVVSGVSRAIGVNGATVYESLTTGSYTAALSGVAPNCTVAGQNPRSVAVVAGDTTLADFAISCATIPPSTGSIEVSTQTTGSDPDPDGYTVTVDGVSRSIGGNASTTFTGLTAGARSVSLSGVASNCSVGGANPRSVTVVGGQTASTAFAVTCQGITPPPTATELRFVTQPPAAQVVGSGFGVMVSATNAAGDEVPTFTGQVTLTLVGGLPGVTLTGTTSRAAVGGIATFLGLGVSGPCVGCRVLASSAPLASATSDAFTVVIPGLSR